MSGTIAVVGAGQAGGWAARTLRDQGYDGRVLLVGAERHPPYERPPLSKGMLTGGATPGGATIFTAPALAELRVEWRPGVECLSIDRDRRRAILSEGEAIQYDELILCTGGRARTLIVPGAELPGVFTLRTMEDAAAIAGRFAPGRRLVAIGGGWIGLEVAASARKAGLEATVVEAESRLCARTIPPVASSYLRSLHEGHGTQVRLGVGVECIARTAEGALAVTLGSGEVLPADIVVIGVGLVPNDELARQAGLECRGGIEVDAQCRTSDPHIFAAGDVTAVFSRWYGRRLRLESWQNAQDQGVAAAKAALGKDVSYDPLPRFWSDQYDVTVQILGCIAAERGETVVRQHPESGRLLVFLVDGNRLLGVLGVKAAADLSKARRILQKDKPVLVESLRDPEFDLGSV